MKRILALILFANALVAAPSFAKTEVIDCLSRAIDNRLGASAHFAVRRGPTGLTLAIYMAGLHTISKGDSPFYQACYINSLKPQAAVLKGPAPYVVELSADQYSVVVPAGEELWLYSPETAAYIRVGTFLDAVESDLRAPYEPGTDPAIIATGASDLVFNLFENVQITRAEQKSVEIFFGLGGHYTQITKLELLVTVGERSIPFRYKDKLSYTLPGT